MMKVNKFLYPRVISVRRPNTDTAFGVQQYSGVTAAYETAVLTGIPASIQLDRKSGAPDAKTPSDTYNRVSFNVLIPPSAASLGQITEHDIVIDDIGKRYQVSGAYWDSLGYNLTADLLES